MSHEEIQNFNWQTSCRRNVREMIKVHVKIILKLMSHNVLRRFNYTEASNKVIFNGGLFYRGEEHVAVP
jgi:hypothetical protein